MGKRREGRGIGTPTFALSFYNIDLIIVLFFVKLKQIYVIYL